MLDWVAVRGVAAMTLGTGEEREVEKIPEQLKRFLEPGGRDGGDAGSGGRAGGGADTGAVGAVLVNIKPRV